MALTTVHAGELLSLLLNNANIANIGDATGLRGSSASGNLFLSLHTSSPGVGGDQTTNETNYTGYSRLSVTRAGTGWTVTNNAATPQATLAFAACTAGGPHTITHVGIGTSSSGAGKLLHFGTLTPNLTIANGTTPQLTTSTQISMS